MTSTRKSVSVRGATYGYLKSYAESVGKSVNEVVDGWICETVPAEPDRDADAEEVVQKRLSARKMRLVKKTGAPVTYEDKNPRGGGCCEM